MTSTGNSNYDDFSDDELRQEMVRQVTAERAKRATKVADVASTIIVISAAVQVIVGVALAASTQRSMSGGTEHPHVGLGVTIIAAAVVQACFGLMLSLGISSVTQYVHYRAEYDYFE